jgi:hypothetical protein
MKVIPYRVASGLAVMIQLLGLGVSGRPALARWW